MYLNVTCWVRYQTKGTFSAYGCDIANLEYPACLFKLVSSYTVYPADANISPEIPMAQR